ncbi:MAG: DUF362 domain-containing protein [Spirochaetaceae bacterium]|nr:DUF362 domain-containing protein [Spirochaetaceae bacterium]
MSVVALIGCPSYDSQSVLAAVTRGIDLLGGPGAFVRPGEKILLKPNMLAARSPQQAVTTHPEVFAAAARLFAEAGAVLSYGDSPGYGSLSHAARKTEIAEAAGRLGITQADFETVVSVPSPDGGSFPLAHGVHAADGVISLCKMKTHGLTRITGAVKNQLGCIVGFEKARLHFLYPNPQRFSARLAEITRIVNPRLYIMDGILAMEGEGPSGGNPVAMNVLLFSRDPVALDCVFCKLIALDPAHVPTIAAAAAIGLGAADDITLAGDSITGFIKPDFDVVRRPVTGDILFRPLRPFRNSILPRPVINAAPCKNCGVCVDACPAEPQKALAFPAGGKSPPRLTVRRCIRCYCCQEMCPHRAITIATPLAGRILARLLGKH